MTKTPGKTIQFKNCRLIRNHRIIIDDLWIRNGKIINPEPVFFDEKIPADEQIDCNGSIIAPGFIDIQINGKMRIVTWGKIAMNICTFYSQVGSA